MNIIHHTLKFHFGSIYRNIHLHVKQFLNLFIISKYSKHKTCCVWWKQKSLWETCMIKWMTSKNPTCSNSDVSNGTLHLCPLNVFPKLSFNKAWSLIGTMWWRVMHLLNILFILKNIIIFRLSWAKKQVSIETYNVNIKHIKGDTTKWIIMVIMWNSKWKNNER